MPPFSLGGPDDYDISPDGQEVCYSINNDPVPATSTNSDLYVVSIKGGDAKKITSNPGADSARNIRPTASTSRIGASSRAGYESDRLHLLVYDRLPGAIANLTETLDRWVNSFTWSPDSTRLLFTTNDRGRQCIQMISVQGGATIGARQRRLPL